MGVFKKRLVFLMYGYGTAERIFQEAVGAHMVEMPVSVYDVLCYDAVVLERGLYLFRIPARVYHDPFFRILVKDYVAIYFERPYDYLQDLCHSLIFSEYLFTRLLAASSVDASATSMKYGMSWLG